MPIGARREADRKPKGSRVHLSVVVGVETPVVDQRPVEFVLDRTTMIYTNPLPIALSCFLGGHEGGQVLETKVFYSGKLSSFRSRPRTWRTLVRFD